MMRLADLGFNTFHQRYHLEAAVYLSVLSYLILASDLIFLRLRAYSFAIVMIPL